MQTTVYVDVLLVLNYTITALLVVCTTKFMGIQTKRRKIVAAALLGALGSLTIFLPFLGFFTELLLRLGLSAAIVLVALPTGSALQFLKGWGVFFSVSFFFAGVMLGIWMTFAPGGMLYYNGIVYFNVSPFALLITTVAAYLLLGVWNRVSRAGRLQGNRCRATILYRGKECSLDALIDSGNGLCEPFSGTPVIVCRLDAIRPLLDPELSAALRNGDWFEIAARTGTRLRLIPFRSLGGEGTLPAFRADALITEQGGSFFRSERVYAAISTGKIGDGSFSALLNPDLIGIKI